MIKIIVAVLLTLSLSYADTPPSLMKTIWSCDIPCETTDPTPKPLTIMQIGWCASVVLSPDMFETLTPLCQKQNHRTDARATAFSAPSGLHAKCTTSANNCEKVGPVRVGYSCRVQCPGESNLRHFSVCAYNSSEAWSAAPQVCENAQSPLPNSIPLFERCDPNGQTPCGSP